MRYTAKTVDGHYERAVLAATRAGVETDGWQLYADGMSYALVRSPGDRFHLGASAREACETLSHMIEAWLMVADAPIMRPVRRVS